MTRELIQRLVLYKRSIGQSDVDILTGMFHTIITTLDMQHPDAQKAIRDAEFSKVVSDIAFDADNVSVYNHDKLSHVSNKHDSMAVNSSRRQYEHDSMAYIASLFKP